jgi:hypothetical protein
MSYADALADLKATYGNKKLLTPAEVAPFIGKSPSAQAKLRERDKFPIKPKPGMGSRVVMSIYDVAHYIGDEPEQIDVKPTDKRTERPRKTSAKTAKAIDTSKPYRRPPSLGKTLRAFRARLDALSLQLEFEGALFAELERIAMDKIAKPGRNAKRKNV